MDKDIRIGDKVEIINYGSLMWEDLSKGAFFSNCKSFKTYSIHGDIIWFDTCPQLVGQQGVVSATSGSGYALHGISGKTSWYDEAQLKVVKKGTNHK